MRGTPGKLSDQDATAALFTATAVRAAVNLAYTAGTMTDAESRSAYAGAIAGCAALQTAPSLAAMTDEEAASTPAVVALTQIRFSGASTFAPGGQGIVAALRSLPAGSGGFEVGIGTDGGLTIQMGAPHAGMFAATYSPYVGCSAGTTA